MRDNRHTFTYANSLYSAFFQRTHSLFYCCSCQYFVHLYSAKRIIMSDNYYQNVYTQEQPLGTAGECCNRERTSNFAWTVWTVRHIVFLICLLPLKSVSTKQIYFFCLQNILSASVTTHRCRRTTTVRRMQQFFAFWSVCWRSLTE